MASILTTSNSDTLVIKHLPNILSNEEKEDLLKHFGAMEVKCISSKVKKYNLVFARFENEKVAENVLYRLHQLPVLDSRLSVEFAKEKIPTELPKPKEIEEDSETEDEKYYQKFLEKLNSWHCGVDFTQPVPSHLRYQYPPPDDLTLLNIAKILATVPKFYTQVLHLMNKMNLPCPIGQEIMPEFKINLTRQEEPQVIETTEPMQEEEKNEESSESEISTDEEIPQQKETIPECPKLPKKKQIKKPKFVKPVVVESTKKKKTSFEEVFETVDENKPKKIKLSHPPKLDVIPTSSSEGEIGGFGYIHPISKPQEPVVEEKIDVRDEREEERLEKEEIICITSQELAANRISEKDRSILPVYKNYAEGAPTCRLYVKNLAKTVTEEDLKFIYSRYLTRELGEDPDIFNIRLMQEGRMKGQAFVTLQSVELAKTALKETNGYILKDKPLVVQFARSATK